jgi:hypothetical protein
VARYSRLMTMRFVVCLFCKPPGSSHGWHVHDSQVPITRLLVSVAATAPAFAPDAEMRASLNVFESPPPLIPAAITLRFWVPHLLEH